MRDEQKHLTEADSSTSRRFGVGSPSERRSGTFGIQTSRRGDIYIWSRAAAGEAKVSLHASGACHFKHVPRGAVRLLTFAQPAARNVPPILDCWRRAVGEPLSPVFVIGVPESGLSLWPPERRTRQVDWFPAPSVGSAFTMTFWVGTRGSLPIDWSSLRMRPYAELQLATGETFLVTYDYEELSDEHRAKQREREALLLEDDALAEGFNAAVLYGRTLEGVRWYTDQSV
jgi:hypothetical protein